MTAPDPQAAALADGLTKAERAALVPWTTFSDEVGESLIRKGLLQCVDGVWTHTKLGMKVRRLTRKDSPHG